jgi:DNA repair exonuclease SbcCD ATPase subunit
MIFGSVAAKVVLLANCPALTVTARPSAEAKKEITAEKGEEVKTREEKSEKKKAYQEKIEAQLKEWGAKIEELKIKAEKSKGDLKTKYEKRIQELQAKQTVVQQKLRELRGSGEEAWEGLKTGVEKSLDELKGSLDRTLLTFKEKGKEAMDAVSKKKRAYVEKTEAQLREWGTEIDLLKAKAEKAKAEVKVAYLKQVKELKSKQESVKRRFRELRASGDEAWEDFKGEVEEATKDLKAALKRAASRFKKS